MGPSPLEFVCAVPPSFQSTKGGCFVYGCQSPLSPLLPLFLLRHLPFVSLRDCVFTVAPSKTGTARAVAFNELGVTKSYTLEVSLSGYVEPGGEAKHFLLEGSLRAM